MAKICQNIDEQAGGDMEPDVWERKLGANIKSSYDAFRKICKNVQRGIITEAEARNLFEQELESCLINLWTISDGVIIPDVHPGHFPGNVVVGFDIWENNGGLSEETFKLGDSIILTDHYGLKAEIRVTEQTCERKCGTGFTGFGTIEGYTASEPKKIKIEMVNGQIHSLSFNQDSNDDAAFKGFSLWQEALEKYRMAIERQESIVAELMRYFMEEQQFQLSA